MVLLGLECLAQMQPPTGVQCGRPWSCLQEVMPHEPEAMAVQGAAVQASQQGSEIGVEEIAASLRLEHASVAAALMKAREAVEKQQQQQQRQQSKQVAAAAAASAAAAKKPKVSLAWPDRRSCEQMLTSRRNEAAWWHYKNPSTAALVQAAVAASARTRQKVAVMGSTYLHQQQGKKRSYSSKECIPAPRCKMCGYRQTVTVRNSAASTAEMKWLVPSQTAFGEQPMRC